MSFQLGQGLINHTRTKNLVILVSNLQYVRKINLFFSIFHQYVSLATPVFAETTFITTYNDRDVTKFSHISFKPTVCTKDQSII